MKNPFRTIKALILNRRKDKTGKFIANIDTIRKLIEKDLLFVDYKKPYVCLSLRMHMAFMDDEFKLNNWRFRLLCKLGLVQRDIRYVALMESILAFINFYRGLNKLPVYKSNERLDFMVMNMENTCPLLVGFYQEGEVEYASLKETENIENLAM